jgi:hypothetical protein
MAKTKPAFIERDFNDGETERFTKGAVVDLDEGRFLNFSVAGLVREATADEIKAAKAAQAGTAAT